MIVYLLFVHWIADFVCQTRYMAENKGKDIFVLTYHICAYTAVLAVFTIMLVSPTYVLWNGAAHFVVDYFTSKATSYLWEQKKVHAFFVVIGFDQFLHVALLYLTVGVL